MQLFRKSIIFVLKNDLDKSHCCLKTPVFTNDCYMKIPVYDILFTVQLRGVDAPADAFSYIFPPVAFSKIIIKPVSAFVSKSKAVQV